MSKLGVTLDILNQKGTPAFYSDIFTNRPAAGFAGRVFISTDTGAIYEDTGSTWTLIADAGAGSSNTLEVVTTNGNTTTKGISITAGGLSSNQISIVGGTSAQILAANGSVITAGTNITISGGTIQAATSSIGGGITGSTTGSLLFVGSGSVLAQDNTNLFWDNTSKYFGIGPTGGPTAPLDIHNGSVNVLMQLNATSTNNSNIAFLNGGVGKWRVGNLYNAGANSFQIYDVLNTTARLTILNSGATTLNGALTSTSVAITGGTSAQFLKADGSVDSNTYFTTNTNQTIASSVTKTFNGETRFGLGTSYDNSTGVSLTTGFTTVNAGLTGSNTFIQVSRSNAYNFNIKCDLTSSGSSFLLPSGQTNALIATATGTSSQLIAGDGTLISAGTNITISAGTISASGGGSGVTSLSAIGSTANANGATITGSVLNLQPASASFGGVITTGTQTIAGDKTINGNLTLTTASNTFVNIVSTASFPLIQVSDNRTTSKAWNIENGRAGSGVFGLFYSPNNTTYLAIPSSGNVLIGTTTDAGYKLDVQGTLRTTGAASFNTTVSIATATATAALNVQGANGSNTALITGNSTSGGSYGLLISSGTTTSDYALKITNQTGASNFMIVNGVGSTLLGTSTDNGQGVLQVTGGITANDISLTGATYSATATITKNYYSLFTGSTGQTLTLPSPSSNNYQYVIINTTANSVTIAAATSTNIITTTNTSVASITLIANARCFLIADGNNKYYQVY